MAVAKPVNPSLKGSAAKESVMRPRREPVAFGLLCSDEHGDGGGQGDEEVDDGDRRIVRPEFEGLQRVGRCQRHADDRAGQCADRSGEEEIVEEHERDDGDEGGAEDIREHRQRVTVRGGGRATVRLDHLPRLADVVSEFSLRGPWIGVGPGRGQHTSLVLAHAVDALGLLVIGASRLIIGPSRLVIGSGRLIV